MFWTVRNQYENFWHHIPWRKWPQLTTIKTQMTLNQASVESWIISKKKASDRNGFLFPEAFVFKV